MGDIKGVCKVSVERIDGERLLGRPRPRWKNNIKMDLQDLGWGMDLFESGCE